MPALHVLKIHSSDSPTRDACLGDDGRATWASGTPLVVEEMVTDNPVCVDGVEHGEEGDEVCVFAHTPGIVILSGGRDRWSRAKWVGDVRNRIWPPNELILSSPHILSELIVVVAVQFGDPEPLTSLPDTLSWLAATKVCNPLHELVHVSSETGVHLPVPEEVKLRISPGKVLYGEPLRKMDAVWPLVLSQVTLQKGDSCVLEH